MQSWSKPELAAYAWFASLASRPGTPNEAQIPAHGTPQLMLSPSIFAPGWSWFEAARTPRTPGELDKKSIVEEVMGRLRGRPEPSTPNELPDTIVKLVTEFENTAAPDDNPFKLQMRLDLASEAIRTFPAIAERFTPRTRTTSSGETVHWNEPILEQLVLTALGDWPSDHFLQGIDDKVMGMAMWFASMGYSAIHACGWNDYFPTQTERILWRFSSVYMLCSGALWVLLCLFSLKSHWARLYWDRFKFLRATWVEYGIIGGTMVACGLTYIFARIFLVVDGLVSLRALPRDAYDVPDWTTLIPHL